MKKNILLWSAIGMFTFGLNAQTTVELIKDINPNGNSVPRYFNDFNSKMLFIAKDDPTGFQVWLSDGTGAGTEKISNVPHTDDFGFEFEKLNGEMIFSTYDPVDELNSTLWKTDGTAQGTDSLKIFQLYGFGVNKIKGLTEVNGKVIFQAYDYAHNVELWVTDGTAAGTKILKDINPNGFSTPVGFTKFNGNVIFSADNGPAGHQLWITDGTEAGTVLLKTINPLTGSFPSNFKELNGKLYFYANDETQTINLWVTDGTANGTTRVKSFLPNGCQYTLNFEEMNGKLYFPLDDGIRGYQLWVTDGTEQGTEMVKLINSSGEAIKSELTRMDNKIYFGGSDGGANGTQLWSTDGTAAGTSMVKKINLTGDGNPTNFKKHLNKIYFTAFRGTNNHQLHESDGTAAGTLAILPPFLTQAFPVIITDEFFEYSNGLYFTANFSNIGWELYKLSASGLNSISENQSAVNYSAFPNPTTDILTISTDKESQFTLYDLTGKALRTVDVIQSTELSISELNVGIYILRENGSSNFMKIIKE